MTEVGITRTPRFLVTLERHLAIYLAETFVKVCLFLISRVVYDLSVHRELFQR